MGCVTGGEMRISLSTRFDINYDNIPPEEKEKVKKMADSLDNCGEYINNLEIRDKVNEIIIDNQDTLIEQHSIKREQKIENIKGWVYTLTFTAGALCGGFIAWLAVRASRK